MEKLYQYLWKSHMFGRKLREVSGRSVEVLDPGRPNTDAGPDFFNSKIKIDGLEWVGNVEIHVKASDWHRHGHDTDPAYDTVVLHAVGVSDCKVQRTDGTVIPQVEMEMPPSLAETYAMLEESDRGIRCAESIGSIPELAVTDWLETLSVERLQHKAARVASELSASGGDWEQVCFTTLARALGFGLNSDPFEMLARSVPIKLIHRHSDNPHQIQALLFGQAAMLDPSLHIFDEYYQLLCREYYFLARKYGLKPMRPGLWKYARTRPQNFPHRRIALLSKACEGGFSLFSDILEAMGDTERLRGLFRWKPDGYWESRSSFDANPSKGTSPLSDTSLSLLIVNAAVPLAYAWACRNADSDLAEKAFETLDQLPPEKNSVTSAWESIGLGSSNARRSQALLHLKREYCEPRKCLYCRFGHQTLRMAASHSFRPARQI